MGPNPLSWKRWRSGSPGLLFGAFVGPDTLERRSVYSGFRVDGAIPKKVVYMDPHIKNVFGFVPHLF